MNPFRSKIICSKCQKKFLRKIEKNKVKFICGGYHTKTGCTERVVVTEEFIRGLINRRFEKEVSDEELVEILDYILIEDALLMEIHFKKAMPPILLKGSFIQF